MKKILSISGMIMITLAIHAECCVRVDEQGRENVGGINFLTQLDRQGGKLDSNSEFLKRGQAIASWGMEKFIKVNIYELNLISNYYYGRVGQDVWDVLNKFPRDNERLATLVYYFAVRKPEYKRYYVLLNKLGKKGRSLAKRLKQERNVSREYEAGANSNNTRPAKVSAEYIMKHRNLNKKSDFIYFLSLLDRSEKWPDGAVELLNKRYENTQSLYIQELIVHVAVKNKKLMRMLSGRMDDFIKKRKISSIKEKSLVAWSIIAGRDDLDKVILNSSRYWNYGDIVYKYGVMSGDYNKAVEFANSAIGRLKIKYWMNLHQINEIKKAMQRWLYFKNNLSDSNRIEILKMRFAVKDKYYSSHVTGGREVHTQNLPAMLKLLEEHKYRNTVLKELPIGEVSCLNADLLQKIFDEYLKMLESNNSATRLASLRKLRIFVGTKMQHKAVGALLDELKDLNDNNRLVARASLKAMGTRITNDLLTAISGKDTLSAVEACNIIAVMSVLGKPAGTALRESLRKTKDWTVKMAIIRALALVGDRDALPDIKNASKDKNKLVRKMAHQAGIILEKNVVEN
jgi:hypothetical protein